jgi:hypothetical protein
MSRSFNDHDDEELIDRRYDGTSLVKTTLERQDQSAVKNLLEAIRKATSDWFAEFKKMDATYYVKSKLDPWRNKILLGLIGMKDDYGKLEIDTNNRDSPIIAAKRAEISKAGSDWLTANLGTLPTVDDQTVAKLKSDYLNEYRSHMSQLVRDAAKNAAKADASKIVSMVGYDPDEIVKLIKAMTAAEVQTAPKATGKQWKKQGVLSDAAVITIIRVKEDGSITTAEIENPQSDTWCLVKLKAAWSNAFAFIITNGDTWHPLSKCLPDYVNDAPTLTIWLNEYSQSLMAVSDFQHVDDKMFNLMNDVDEVLVSQRVLKFLDA